jgi:hypothetical protein
MRQILNLASYAPHDAERAEVVVSSSSLRPRQTSDSEADSHRRET